jgi:uncharacterized membrane protein (DUF2068 family)
MPFEIHEILHKSTPIRWALLVGNIAVVAYVAWIRYTGRHLSTAVRNQKATESTG